MLRSICFEDLSISPMRHLIQNIIFQKMESVGCCAAFAFSRDPTHVFFFEFSLEEEMYLFVSLPSTFSEMFSMSLQV